MTVRWLVAAMAAWSISCVHESHMAKAPAVPRTQPKPTPLNVWERQIRNAVDAGDGDYALRVLRQKVAAEPDRVDLRIELAKAYQQRGYPDMALELCRLAAARFPDSGEAQLGLVRALRAMDLRQDAIEGLDAFLHSHPQSSPEYYSWLGILRDESDLWAGGEPAHRKAVELAPAVDYLHNNLGYNLLMQKKSEEAATEFREALRLNPGSQMARNNLGLVLARQNAADQAIANWQSSAGPAAAHNNLAAVWMETGNYAAARQELETALSYNRSHPAVLRNLELIGRLESTQVNIHDLPQESWWERWKNGLKKLFLGPIEDSKAGKNERTITAVRP